MTIVETPLQLHITTDHGHVGIIQLLLCYEVNRTTLNN